MSSYINYVAERASTEDRIGNFVKADGSIGRKPRKECYLCGAKMFSFQYALCWECAQKKTADDRDRPKKWIEAGKAILAIEARKKEIAAARRKR